MQHQLARHGREQDRPPTTGDETNDHMDYLAKRATVVTLREATDVYAGLGAMTEEHALPTYWTANEPILSATHARVKAK